MLDELIQEIVNYNTESSVIVSLDAPLNMPMRFDVAGSNLPNAQWPFNVNPFSVRPCEKALSSKPKILNDKLDNVDLAQTLAVICDWQGDYKYNTKFTDIHQGVSVLGYQGAPHGPVVRLFRDQLSQALQHIGAKTVFSPWSALEAEKGHVYVLESHPAVTMALWACQGQLEGFNTIPKYKGGRQDEIVNNFQNLCMQVRQLAGAYLDTNDLSIEDDDDLDAFVGFLNVIDLIYERGDWIGTVEQGYFLSPKIQGIPNDRLMSEIWRDASP